MGVMKTMTSVAVAAGLALTGTAHAASTQSVNMLPTNSYAKRATAPVDAASELNGRGSSVLLGILAAALFIGGIIILADGDDKADSPG